MHEMRKFFGGTKYVHNIKKMSLKLNKTLQVLLGRGSITFKFSYSCKY